MEMNKNPATAWTEAVGQLQQDIMRQWQQAARPPVEMSAMLGAWAPFAIPGAMPGMAPSMMAGMMPNAMAGAMAGAMPGAMSAVPNIASMMSSMMPGMAAPAPAPGSPMAAWDQYFKFSKSIAEQFGALPGAAHDPNAQAKQFATAMDDWFRKLGGSNPLMAAFSQMMSKGMPGGMGGAPAAGSPSAGAESSSASPLPALGLLREHQEAWQRLTQSATKLQQLQGEFSTLWTQVGNDAADKFGNAISARTAGGQRVGSIMEVYNLWVECAEQCYAKVAHSAEYARIVAALTNTVHELRLEQQRQAEAWARQLDLPTRSELNELHRQIRELRAELAEQGGPSSPRRGF
jgi:class III poly(R)-hydroxyalkanoic acid synthase PhaE subunit